MKNKTPIRDNEVTYGIIEIKDLSSLKDGTIKIDIANDSETMDGLYVITEEKAPEVYAKSFDKYYIQISQTDRTIKLVKVTNGLGVSKDYTNKDSGGNTVTIKAQDWKDSNNYPVLYSENADGSKNENVSLALGIINRQIIMPATGGPGSLFLVLGGVLVIIIGIVLFERKMSKEKYN